MATGSRNTRQSPSPPAKEDLDWMRGVVFEGPEDLAACAKFLKDVGAFLLEEETRLMKRLRLPAGCVG
jgi:hypothetical protein